MTNLVIVESPAKAKTIAKFLGKEFTVQSCFGHIRDLPNKKIGVDIENDFAPQYEVSADKTDIIRQLKKLVKNSDIVYLASDEDREGEAIAWHLVAALQLPSEKIKRITFHEITSTAIQGAIKSPRAINQPLVDAQQARRVLDRLVGYELSPLLWKKIRLGLSAGRVQSVAVRLIVERERLINDFVSSSVWRIAADLTAHKTPFKAINEQTKDEKNSRQYLELLPKNPLVVQDVVSTTGSRNPSPPFTTSTLQQEASGKLGFSVKKTMVVAQRLYEAGKITYMRTDSVQLSKQALAEAKKVITNKFGAKSHQVRQYVTKNNKAQETHEAIRPTSLAVDNLSAEKDQASLYRLIWRRTIASQMIPAQLNKTTLKIGHDQLSHPLIAKGEVITEPGFLLAYDRDNETDDKPLPNLVEGDEVQLVSSLARPHFTKPPARFTEASLVKELESLGIGRPSTYAPTIATIQDRGYVNRQSLDPQVRIIIGWQLVPDQSLVPQEIKIEENFAGDKNKLMPTDIGEVVNDFLVTNFATVLDYKFTAGVEDAFDKIAAGEASWQCMVRDFYQDFHPTVEKAAEVPRSEVSKERALGNDPKTNQPIIARMGRFGPLVQMGTSDDDTKPQFASIPSDLKLDQVTLDQALELLSFPRHLGADSEGNDILLNLGKFGPYLRCGDLNATVGKDLDWQKINLKQALQIIADKKEQIKNRVVGSWPDEKLELLRGPYGIYIKHDGQNIRIPKTIANPEKLTLAECLEIVSTAPPKKRFAKSATKSTKTKRSKSTTRKTKSKTKK